MCRTGWRGLTLASGLLLAIAGGLAPRSVAQTGSRGLYLPAGSAPGSLCLDPDNPQLGKHLQRGRWKEGDLLDRAALASDVEFLHRTMRRHYVGYGAMLHRPGFDPAEFFAGWKQQVSSGNGPITFEVGVLRPMMELRRHFRDEHLSVGFAPYGFVFPAGVESEYSEYQTAAFDPALDLASCTPGKGVAPSTLRKVVAVAADGAREQRLTLSALGTAPEYTLMCGKTSLKLVRRQPHRMREQDPPYEWREKEDVGFIFVRSLSAPDEQLAGLAGDYAKHRRKRLLVFDFRGNGGGNTDPVGNWISKAKRGVWSYCKGTVTLESDLTSCRDWNDLVTSQVRAGSVATAEARAARDEQRRRWPALPPEPREVLRPDRREDKAANPFKGKIVALVDRGTGSSAENVAHWLRRALGAIVVGERTSGLLEYGNVVSVILPATGLRANVATRRWFLDEPVEGIGIPVDYYLDDLDAPAESLLPRLEKIVGRFK